MMSRLSHGLKPPEELYKDESGSRCFTSSLGLCKTGLNLCQNKTDLNLAPPELDRPLILVNFQPNMPLKDFYAV